MSKHNIMASKKINDTLLENSDVCYQDHCYFDIDKKTGREKVDEKPIRIEKELIWVKAIPFLIDAVQELQVVIVDLTNRVKELEKNKDKVKV